MKIREFELERYYGKYEFSTRYQLSASDCETVSVGELLEACGTGPEELLGLRLGYTETRGAPALREAIARFYPGCGPERTMVFNAPQEAVFLAMHAQLEKGDRVVVMTPCYPSLKEVAKSLECDVREWRVEETPQGWRLDLERLEELLGEGTKLLVTNAPHNPTGLQPTRAEWERIRELVDARGITWFSDEMYRGLESSPELALPPACTLTERALSLWGASKSFGLPGLRIGWLVSHDEGLLTKIETWKDYTTICSSAPGELLARLALENAEPILERHRRRIAENAGLVGAFVTRHAERFSWFPPAAGPVALVRLAGESASAHAERVRREGDALLVPATFFDLGDEHVRVGLGRADFTEAVQRWERC